MSQTMTLLVDGIEYVRHLHAYVLAEFGGSELATVTPCNHYVRHDPDTVYGHTQISPLPTG
jgi:hypothetical protein